MPSFPEERDAVLDDDSAALTFEDILARMGERPPVLGLLSAVVRRGAAARATYHVRAVGRVDASLCEGHFPGRPVVPFAALGLLAGQACCLGVAHAAAVAGRPTLHGIAGAGRLRLLEARVVAPGEPLVANARMSLARAGKWVGTCVLSRASGEELVRAESVWVVALDVGLLTRPAACSTA